MIYVTAPLPTAISAQDFIASAKSTKKPASIVSQLKEGLDVSIKLGDVKNSFQVVTQLCSITIEGVMHMNVELQDLKYEESISIDVNRKYTIENGSMYLLINLKLAADSEVPVHKNRKVSNKLVSAISWLIKKSNLNTLDAASTLKEGFGLTVPSSFAETLKNEVENYVKQGNPDSVVTFSDTENRGLNKSALAIGTQIVTKVISLYSGSDTFDYVA